MGFCDIEIVSVNLIIIELHVELLDTRHAQLRISFVLLAFLNYVYTNYTYVLEVRSVTVKCVFKFQYVFLIS